MGDQSGHMGPGQMGPGAMGSSQMGPGPMGGQMGGQIGGQMAPGSFPQLASNLKAQATYLFLRAGCSGMAEASCGKQLR